MYLLSFIGYWYTLLLSSAGLACKLLTVFLVFELFMDRGVLKLWKHVLLRNFSI